MATPGIEKVMVRVAFSVGVPDVQQIISLQKVDILSI